MLLIIVHRLGFEVNVVIFCVKHKTLHLLSFFFVDLTYTAFVSLCSQSLYLLRRVGHSTGYYFGDKSHGSSFVLLSTLCDWFA